MIGFLERGMEKGLRTFGILYVITAVSLMLTVTYTFFCILCVEIAPLNGSITMAIHKCLGIILLFNTLFNYSMCIKTPPGSTLDIDESVLYRHYANVGWKFCRVCERPKPCLAHHCSICNKCPALHFTKNIPLRVMCNEVCPQNGSSLPMGCKLCRIPFYCFGLMLRYRSLFLDRYPESLLRIFSFMLSASVGCAVAGLFLWHTFLVATGQGTVDFIENFEKWRAAYKEGRKWRNPHDLGCVLNFKGIFDVDGRFWWLQWMLPVTKKKSGTGLYSIYIPETESV